MVQICPKILSSLKNWTSPFNWAYLIWFLYHISTLTASFNILNQICIKRVFQLFKRKREHHHRIQHIRLLSLGTKFQVKQTILIFCIKFVEKGYFRFKTEKVNIAIQFYIISWYSNSLGTKFQLEQKILIFWTKLARKRYTRSNKEKVSITIEFCIFELTLVPNFSLNRQFYLPSGSARPASQNIY